MNNEEAIKKYLEKIAKAEKHLARIEQYLDDHGEVGPQDVNWAHVGTMTHLADELETLTKFINGEDW